MRYREERRSLAATLPALAVVPAAATAATTPAAFESKIAAAPAGAVTATVAAAARAATEAAAATTESATAATAAAKAAATATATGKRAGLGLEAVTAVHRTIAAGFERNLGLFAARCAGRIEHLPGRPAIGESAVFTSAHCTLPCPPAVGAAPGLSRKALRRMKLLFTRGEHERLAAIAADERLVGVRHPMTLLELRGTYGHRAPVEFCYDLSVRPMERGYRCQRISTAFGCHQNCREFHSTCMKRFPGQDALYCLRRPGLQPGPGPTVPTGKSREPGETATGCSPGKGPSTPTCCGRRLGTWDSARTLAPDPSSPSYRRVPLCAGLHR